MVGIHADGAVAAPAAGVATGCGARSLAVWTTAGSGWQPVTASSRDRAAPVLREWNAFIGNGSTYG
jgi:hypothetical protein